MFSQFVWSLSGSTCLFSLIIQANGSINFKEIISKNGAFYRLHSQQYKILIPLGMITLIFIKCIFSEGITVDKTGYYIAFFAT